ncbi:MAG: 50S ribosomal protein L16 [Patescibacteria group bacterium]
MLMPRKVKYRKSFRAKVKGKATSGNYLSFGSFGLKAVNGGWVTARQIEAARRAMTRFIKRGGKSWIRIFPDRAVSSKGGEARMGGGKGAVDHYVAVVKPGAIIFEMEGVEFDQAKEAFKLASHKLPIKARFISRGEE